MIITADDDIRLLPDDDVLIYAGTTHYASFKGTEQHLEVPAIDFGQDELAYYDEGSWTPTLNNSGTATMSNCRYIRVGDVVHLWALIQNIQESGTQTGDLKVSGLPFSPSISSVIGNCMMHSITFTGGRGNLNVYTDGTDILFYESITGAAWNAIEWGAISDNDDIYFQATYTVQ